MSLFENLGLNWLTESAHRVMNEGCTEADRTNPFTTCFRGTGEFIPAALHIAFITVSALLICTLLAWVSTIPSRRRKRAIDARSKREFEERQLAEAEAARNLSIRLANERAQAEYERRKIAERERREVEFYRDQIEQQNLRPVEAHFHEQLARYQLEHDFFGDGKHRTDSAGFWAEYRAEFPDHARRLEKSRDPAVHGVRFAR